MSFLKPSILTVFSGLLSFFPSYAQNTHRTIVRGLVTDASSNEPLPAVYVMFVNSTIATIADDRGGFSIQSPDTASYLKITFVGYKTALVHIHPGRNQFVHVRLKPLPEELSEVVVKGRRHRHHRYRNRGNPAVELIQKVIQHKSQNVFGNFDDLKYEKYQKILFSFDKVSPWVKKLWLMKPFQFVLNNTDTTIYPGKRLLPVYLREEISDDYFRKNPTSSKEYLKAQKLVSFDKYIDRSTINASINYLYQDVNIYDNNIKLLGNQFLSPIAPLAPTFYKFFISDTTVLDHAKCIRLAFVPRNKSDFLFQGYMFVTLDSLYAIKKITMEVNPRINMNWVKSISIDQGFKKIDKGWILTTNTMNIDFGVTKKTMGLYGQKTDIYRNFQIDKPINDTVFKGTSKVVQGDTLGRSSAYWTLNRPQKLRRSEQNVYRFMDSLKTIRAFRIDMGLLRLMALGFQEVGPVEFGPTMTLYSHNPVEGSRFRLEMRTTRQFNKKLFIETYGAYGTYDHRFKSFAHAVYSLNDKSIRQFPQKSIGISYLNDLKIPGEELQYAQSDNILLSFKRGLNDKMYFDKRFQMEYLNESLNHFSFRMDYAYTRLYAAGNLFFNTNRYSDLASNVNHLNDGRLSVDFRYAPHERFVQGSLYRVIITGKYPVMELNFSMGAPFLGGDYTYQNIWGSISKRFNLSLLGYTDVELEGGKIFGHVPFPLLDIHRANQTYSYQPLSYNLMNFLEFVSDQYAALNIDHNFNGFFFNRVPLLRSLKFREAVTFKLLYGSLSHSNNPSYRSDLLKFPTDVQGNPLTFSLNQKPYMELGFGITNIFKVLRVDYIMRLSYLNHPDISKSGIRFDYKFDF